MMKTIIQLTKKYSQFLFSITIVIGVFSLTSCSEDDPQKEDVPELITKATLTFTPTGGGSLIVVSATDPDGEGVQDIQVDGAINLAANTTYTLALTLINELADPSDEEYNITEEVEEEGDEHMFFYGWTGLVFAEPTGDGNLDDRADAVDYQDEDNTGFPLGLKTKWTTGVEPSSGTFRIVLKHQPQLKSETSDVNTGETDLDVEFEVNVN